MATKTAHERRFELGVPEGWSVLEDAPPQVFAVVERDAEGFASNANVVRYPNHRRRELGALLDENAAGLAKALTGFVLLDRSAEEARLLFTYRRENVGLTGDQRYVLDEDGYYVVTATATNMRFRESADVIQAILDSFETI